MALPQRKDPDNEVRLREVDRPEHVNDGRNAGFAWMWVWWVIFILIIFGWFGGWGWGGYGGWWGWGGARTRTAQQLSRPANTNAILDATNRQAFLGQTISLTNTQVLHKVNDTEFWLGPRDEQSLFVVLAGADNSTKNAGVGEGDQVSVTGAVQKAPAAQQAKRQWHLNDDAAKRLESQGVYLSATQVEKVNR
jgi:hypothetical protein